MPKKKKPLQDFDFNLDLKWSYDIKVKARNKPEAKRKAVEKLLKQLKQKDFNIY